MRREHSFSSSSHPSSVRLSQSERFSNHDMYNLLNGAGNDIHNNGNNGNKIARSCSAGNDRTYADVYGSDPLFNEYVSQLSGQSVGVNRGHEGRNESQSHMDPLSLSPSYRLNNNQFVENRNLNNNQVNRTKSLFQDNLHVEVDAGTDSPVGVTDVSVESGEEEEDVTSAHPTPLILISPNVSTENKKKKSKKKNSLNVQK